jgi:queuine tRNA-ribosyltransferase
VSDGCWQQEAICEDGAARAGWLQTRDGSRLPTPLFQPVATAGTLRTLDWRDLRSLGYAHVLMNTYHLVVRPGLPVIELTGGIKEFTGWRGSILTDSGGFQAYSLGARVSLKRDGVRFVDHIDGGRWHFSPEMVLRAQLAFDVDFAMCLDICTGLPAARARIERDLELTHAWATEQAERWPHLLNEHSLAAPDTPRLLGIVQGGLHEDLRLESIEHLTALAFDGLAVGGLSVGESREDFQRLAAFCGPRLPDRRVRYLMGVGEPADLLYAIAQGFDLFDCVQPTRLARHGTAFTRRGKLHVKHARFTEDRRPLDPGCRCPVCRGYSRAYVRNLFLLKEHSYARLLTLHNLYFYRDLLARARRRIMSASYGRWWRRQVRALDRVLPEDL